MSKIDELIKELCPNGVEWKTLGDNMYFDIENTKRKPVKASSRVYGETPYYGANNVQDYVNGYTHDGEYILIAEDGSASLENYSIQYVNGMFWANNHVHIIRGNYKIKSRFVYHYLTTLNFIPFLTGGTRAKLTKLKLMQIPIPIPPIQIQKEIVRILDNFTELTAEQQARQKQYEYYRDKLLTFDEGEVEFKPLGEIGELIRGNGLPKSDFVETGVPAIHYGQIYTFYGVYTSETISFVSEETAKKLKKVNKGDVVITNTSENIEDVGKALLYLGEQQAVTGGHATIFKPNKEILGKYFAYYTQSAKFNKDKRKYAKGTKVIDVSATDMTKLIIPVPPLAQQQRIVDILDKFDTLTNSITEGLPYEIELRQKQYEYYRDLLLTFPKK